MQGILKGSRLTETIKKCRRFDLFALFSERIKRKIVFCDRDFDYYLCGSDQVWNPLYHKPSYFATFAAKEKRVSYAASFGISALPEQYACKYKDYLNDMQHISVREQTGVEIVQQLTGKDAISLLDPTLMLDKNNWKYISKKPKFNIESKYLLTYFLGTISEETDSYIKKIAEENNLQIISLHKFAKNDYWYHTGPSEFIWLIENASLVCTDSFHASVFSVIMDSPFIVFRRKEKSNDMHTRIENLLSTLNLKDRFFECVKYDELFKKDYRHIPEILTREREKAIKFLSNALNLNDE